LRTGFDKFKKREVDSDTIQKIETKDIEEEPIIENSSFRSRNKKKKKN
jgi:hypothetical protein